MEPKLFFDIFNTILIDDDLKLVFSEVYVKKVSVNHNRTLLKVHIRSNHLIDKKDVYAMETAMKKQLFSGVDTQVRIIEEFALSERYNAKTIYETYDKSILAELKDISPVEYTLYKKIRVETEADNVLKLVLPDNTLAHDSLNRLLELLEKIYIERCGVDVRFVPVFEEDVTAGEHAKENEIMTAREVARIAYNAGYMTDETKEITDSVNEIDNNQSVHSDEDTVAAVKEPVNENADKAGAKNGRENENKSDDRSERFEQRRPLKKSDDPDVLYGRDFDDAPIPISEVIGDSEPVTIRGKIIAVEEKPIRNNKVIVTFDLTDFKDTISVKVFIRDEQLDELKQGIKEGQFVKVKGLASFDSFVKEVNISSLTGVMKISDFTEKRMDYSVRKRVELHCHTKMSDMDGVSDVKDIIKTAYSWGHPAIAITDHGVVQAFPDANHLWDDLWKKEKAKRKEAGEEEPDYNDFFKVIYGVEAYIVDDLARIVTNPVSRNIDKSYVVFDIETTGFSPVRNHITEIGAVKVENGQIVDRFSTFVNPKEPIPYRIVKLTGITDEMVMDAPLIEEVLPKFLEFVGDSIPVAHNAGFDTSFIAENAKRCNMEFTSTYVDTLELSRELLPHLPKYKLDVVCRDLGVSLEGHHRAVNDAEATAECFLKLIDMAKKKNVFDIADLDNMDNEEEDEEKRLANKVKKLRNHHAIILAKNNTGRVNMYTLVSESHLKYLHRGKPCIPKSLLNRYREGLILGTACEAGELFEAILEDRPEAEIAAIVDYYDYLEIQPLGNDMYMIDSDKVENVNSVEDIMEINKRIVELGERFNKPVVATCDVHFLNPEDEIYRRIIMAGIGFADADNQPPLYLRTTEEMLSEFAYLGSEKAEEVVITNTVKIADMIDKISPVRPDKCPPVIENSDVTLREICFTKAHEMYGDPLPEIVQARLEKELNSIISNGYSVMYIIAQKLVWKSNEDGYLVGSRGSVGSSFVATMAGITEVNPLSPHYYCKSCHYTDFDSDEVKAYAGRAGVDMPDKVCPVCGEKLVKDGFDIPFETFLGFKGDKEPDIDLNFSGEYQANAHKYTEVIFGKGQTFKAGTTGALADKTAYGFIKKYYDEKEKQVRNAEINRLVRGCMGVKRSTGQHPGGIVVLPKGENINSFTPVQHPANDINSDIITTHFDYHSIDHNLLKLDILGHDDPTMIRMLQDLIGMDPRTIPLDDPKVMSLFQNTDALGISPEDMGGTPLGCLGIPEFGTQFAMQMLIDAGPKAFSDLVRISGLSHGTNVWQGNAEVLIKNGTATISTAICTRDDIMTYLIEMGVDSANAFSIMENVRKGKVAGHKCGQWEEWKSEMKEHNVPDWYIWSCERIEYMFPKAHAAAYVMMAWRIAYCKIYHPLEYYTAYFTIRAKGFDYEIMCMGRDKVDKKLAEIKKAKENGTEKQSATDKDLETALKSVQEMYARGFEFMPIDLKLVKPTQFSIIDGRIMASLTSIAGLGESVAYGIVEAVKGEPFLSKDDFKARSKASGTITDKLEELGILTGLPESNQISLFDFMR
ncbi:MAG: PolC-type DNA polymerase III [Lachnospiraceae bacterium]|nr:PolC-type DNA polymerase III [Lachnospiraceae bacterium]